MRHCCIASYGKVRTPWVEQEIQKYAKRLQGSFTWVQLRESRNNNPVQRMAEEMDFFLQRFSPAWKRVILSEEGTLMDSLRWSKWLNQQGSSDVVFLVGSAQGIHCNLKAQADLLFSLSPLTFAHEHALVVLAEQIYRGYTIGIGHPYHHA